MQTSLNFVHVGCAEVFISSFCLSVLLNCCLKALGGASLRFHQARDMRETARHILKLKLFISAKHITANVVDGNSGRLVASASTVEHAIKNAFDWGKPSHTKASSSIGEVLAMRLRSQVFGPREVHFNVQKEIEKKGAEESTKVWAILNALRNYGVKIRCDVDHINSSY